MVARGISGNSFRFIGEDDEEDEAGASSLLFLHAATAAVAGNDVSGPALSFFLCFFVEGIVSLNYCAWWSE